MRSPIQGLRNISTLFVSEELRARRVRFAQGFNQTGLQSKVFKKSRHHHFTHSINQFPVQTPVGLLSDNSAKLLEMQIWEKPTVGAEYLPNGTSKCW